MIIYEIPYQYQETIQGIMKYFPRISRYHSNMPKPLNLQPGTEPPRERVKKPCPACEHTDPKHHQQDEMEAAWKWFKAANRLTNLK